MIVKVAKARIVSQPDSIWGVNIFVTEGLNMFDANDKVVVVLESDYERLKALHGR